MNILLINTNPMVSRLVALCMRDQSHHLEEVGAVAQAQGGEYDLVFVDDGSYTVVTEEFVDKLDSVKKVYFSSEHTVPPGFDAVVKKPFLPSQIIEIIRDMQPHTQEAHTEPKETEIKQTDEEAEEAITYETPSIFPMTAESGQDEAPLSSEETENQEEQVLDEDEVAKIKALLEMDEAEEEMKALSDEEYEQRKIEAIKEDLIAQGLEIVNEETIVEEIGGEEVPITPKKDRKTKTKKKHPLTLEELEKLERMFAYTIRKSKPKKLRKLLEGKKVKLKFTDSR